MPTAGGLPDQIEERCDVHMFTGNKPDGTFGSIAAVFLDVARQRCAVHFYGNALAMGPGSKGAVSLRI